MLITAPRSANLADSLAAPVGLVRAPLGAFSPEDGSAWRRAMAVGTAVYDDEHEPVVPGALFYRASSVRTRLGEDPQVVATIGNHVFYW